MINQLPLALASGSQPASHRATAQSFVARVFESQLAGEVEQTL